MTDVFDQAITDLFDDTDITLAATFTPAVGAPVSCQVSVETDVDMQPSGFDATTWSHGTTIEAQLSEIGKEPDRGETFTMTVSGTVYTVKSIMENDGRTVKAAVKES